MNQATISKYFSLILLCVSAITLIGLQLKPLAWAFVLLGVIFTLLTTKTFKKHVLLIYLSLSILGVFPIKTDITFTNITLMGIGLTLALVTPTLVTRFIYKEKIIPWSFSHGRKWKKREFAYILITAILSIFILPFYFHTTGAHFNWTVTLTFSSIVLLFLGTNVLGIWDEFFFINTVLALLKQHVPFQIANLIQAIIFTSFLYELGFTGWGPLMIFPFALLQGLIFEKTDSLFYVISIHLTLDFILFLALIHAHFPQYLTFFPFF